MQEMELAILAATSPSVQIWMNWMLIIFLLSILFVWKYKPARAVLAAFVLTVPIALMVFNLWSSAHLIGIAHLLLWVPLAYYLFSKEFKNPQFNVKSFYGVWLVLLMATIAISVVFDIRDIVLVLLGEK